MAPRRPSSRSGQRFKTPGHSGPASSVVASPEGPIDSFSDADSYLASLRQLSGIVTGAEKRKVFVDGDDVCVIYDLKTTPVPSSRTCEWYRLRDGKIASVSVVFDARPFAPLFGAQPGG
jgi:hypothetical protein